jgi:uncharacterized protein involved in cysteine biosynthesis
VEGRRRTGVRRIAAGMTYHAGVRPDVALPLLLLAALKVVLVHCGGTSSVHVPPHLLPDLPDHLHALAGVVAQIVHAWAVPIVRHFLQPELAHVRAMDVAVSLQYLYAPEQVSEAGT